jgi:LysR family cyn operon transcriptional activator
VELRHLRSFLAVARTQHFRRAADELYVSQPALSEQIRQLEAELGTPLFERLGRRVRLTAAGVVLRDYAERVLREVDDARRAIEELENLSRGTLAAGVVQTVNTYLIPAVLARLAVAHPGICVRVDELPAAGIEAALEAGELDLGVGFVPPAASGLVAEPLFTEELVVIVPESHRLAGRPAVAFRELDGEPLILLSPRFCTRRLFDACTAGAGVCPQVRIEMNSIEGILATVRATGLATVLPALALRCAEGTGLRGVPLVEPSPRRTVGLLWRRCGYRCAAARAFAAAVAEVVERYSLPRAGVQQTQVPAGAFLG